MFRKGIFTLILIMLLPSVGFCMTKTLAPAGGDWAVGATWIGDGFPPNSGDDLVANASSGAVTVSGTVSCKSVDFSGKPTVSFTMNTGSRVVVFNGSFIMPATATGSMAVGAVIDMRGTGTLIPPPFNYPSIEINSSGTVTLGSNYSSSTITSTLTLTKGIFDTAGYTIYTGIFSSTGDLDRTFYMRNSSLTFSGSTAPWTVSGNNFHLYCGTSTLNMNTGGTPVFTGGGNTYYTVAYNGGASTITLTAPNDTFYSLLFSSPSSSGTTVNLASDLNITSTLNILGYNETTLRTQFKSSAIDVQHTINFGASGMVTGGWFDMRNIISSKPIRLDLLVKTTGDEGGNVNFTFTPAVPLWWKGGTASWGSSAALWSATAGGAAGTGRFPLPQDTAYFTNYASPYTVTCNFARIPSVVSSDSGTRLFTLSSPGSFYGSLDLTGANTTVGGSANMTLNGGGSQTLAFRASLTQAWSISAGVGGTYTLNTAMTTSGAIQIASGTFNTNGYTVTSSSNITSTGTLVRNIIAGNSTFSSLGWSITGSGYQAFDMQNSTISLITTAAARTFNGAGQSYGNFSCGNGGSLAFNGNNSFKNFSLGSSLSVGFAGNQRIFGTFTDAGYAANKTTIYTNNGSILVKPYNIVTGDYLTITNLAVTGGAYWISGPNSTGGGTNGWDNTRAPSSQMDPMAMAF